MNNPLTYILLGMLIALTISINIQFDDLKQEMHRDHIEVIEKIQRIGK